MNLWIEQGGTPRGTEIHSGVAYITPSPQFLLPTSQISHHANSLPCRNPPPVILRSVVLQLQLHPSFIVVFELRVLANRQVNDSLSRRCFHCSVARRGHILLEQSHKDAGHIQYVIRHIPVQQPSSQVWPCSPPLSCPKLPSRHAPTRLRRRQQP